jgi:RNA-directed DNA polymerase
VGCGQGYEGVPSFDRLAHDALLAQLTPRPYLRRQRRTWLNAGVCAHGTLFPTEAGPIQGSPLSPLLTHIALHGLETALTQAFPHRGRQHGPPPKVVIYADDLGMLHQDRSGIEHGQQLVSEWLRPLGLTLKPSKTRITPTLETNDGQPGFDCLGFPLRQYPVGRAPSGKDSHGRLLGCKTLITPSRAAITRQRTKLPQSIARAKQTTQDTFIGTRAPHIRGWSHDYSRVVSAQVFRPLDYTRYAQLRSWAIARHPKQSKPWIMAKYGRVDEGKGWRFPPPREGRALTLHSHPSIRRHVKVQATRSPYDGDWVYWSTRLGLLC